AVRTVRASGQFPVVLSGNCNSAVGTLSGLTPARRAVCWFDAHGYCNSPDTTATGFLDGMGLATVLGLCWHQLAASVPGYHPVSPRMRPNLMFSRSSAGQRSQRSTLFLPTVLIRRCTFTGNDRG